MDFGWRSFLRRWRLWGVLASLEYTQLLTTYLSPLFCRTFAIVLVPVSSRKIRSLFVCEYLWLYLFCLQLPLLACPHFLRLL